MASFWDANRSSWNFPNTSSPQYTPPGPDPIEADTRPEEEMAYTPADQARIDRALTTYRQQQQQAQQRREMQQPTTYLGPVVRQETMPTTNYNIPDRLLGPATPAIQPLPWQTTSQAPQMRQESLPAPQGYPMQGLPEARREAGAPRYNYNLGNMQASRVQPGMAGAGPLTRAQMPPAGQQARMSRADLEDYASMAGIQYTPEVQAGQASSDRQYDPNTRSWRPVPQIQPLPWGGDPQIAPLPWRSDQSIYVEARPQRTYIPYMSR